MLGYNRHPSGTMVLGEERLVSQKSQSWIWTLFSLAVGTFRLERRSTDRRREALPFLALAVRGPCL